MLHRVFYFCLAYLDFSTVHKLYFPSPDTICHFSKEILFPFIRKWCLKGKIWVLGILIAIRISFLLDSVIGESKVIYVCILTHVYTHIYNCLCRYKHIYNYIYKHKLYTYKYVHIQHLNMNSY